MRRFDAAYPRAEGDTGERRHRCTPLFPQRPSQPSVPSDHVSDMVRNDTCEHDIDIARCVLDDDVAAVTVKNPRRNNRSREDLRDPTFVPLEMAGGALVDIEISVSIHPCAIRSRLGGSDSRGVAS
ncbi:MAG: hypothetical protein K8F58_13650 [Bauldia sp.]|nr:hypothetical protein [Bauldia sp.]